MKIVLGTISALILIATIAYSRSHAMIPIRSQASAEELSDSCPYKTAADWQKFLERAANNEKWVATCEDSECDSKYYRQVQTEVQGVFERCKNFILSHQNIASCTDHMRRFTPAWMRQHDPDSYGFAVDNHAYLQAQEAPDKPTGMMKIPDEIVAALPDRERVEQAARENGFKYLTHDSALSGYRTFIFNPDPQGRFDQWMLLNLQKGDSSVEDHTPLSILTVLKKDAQGQPLEHVRVYFRDYTIMPQKNGYRLSLFEDNNGKCYSCHTNGVRQLIARHTPILEAEPVRGENVTDTRDFAYQRLLEFNRKLRSYGAPDWEGNIVPENNGPALGKGQRCTECHNGYSRSALTVFTSPNQIEQKMVKELSMPPDTPFVALLDRQQTKSPALSGKEEGALNEAYHHSAELAREFEESRFPALREWFLKTSCR